MLAFTKLHDLDFDAAVDHDGASVWTVGDYVLRNLDLSKFEFLSNGFFLRSRGAQITVVNRPS